MRVHISLNNLFFEILTSIYYFVVPNLLRALSMDGHLCTVPHSGTTLNVFGCLLKQGQITMLVITASGQTPLHLAASNYRTPHTLIYLLSLPDINLHTLKNAQGSSAADIINRSTPLSKLLYPFSESLTRIPY
ncbi:unnamed protein product [Protopolystoma xenopodis]|uniref:Uncharacterized protein n=1 Tax=Protopolystoma xenopodis TaxID=117903 RepID=A0A448WJI8_9PLAT|nr:unnamed protein product [Protopolystoma xenopodis]